MRENCQGLDCAYVNSTGAIWTPMVFTQFFLGIIASRVKFKYTMMGWVATCHHLRHSAFNKLFTRNTVILDDHDMFCQSGENKAQSATCHCAGGRHTDRQSTPMIPNKNYYMPRPCHICIQDGPSLPPSLLKHVGYACWITQIR